jgi:hypothetical protein
MAIYGTKGLAVSLGFSGLFAGMAGYCLSTWTGFGDSKKVALGCGAAGAGYQFYEENRTLKGRQRRRDEHNEFLVSKGKEPMEPLQHQWGDSQGMTQFFTALGLVVLGIPTAITIYTQRKK